MTRFLAAATTLLLAAHGAVAQSGMVFGNVRAVMVVGDAWQDSVKGQSERLKQGDFLRQGSEVRTSGGARVILLFDNGATIEIRPGTRFSIDKFLVDPLDAESIDYQKITREPTRSMTRISVPQGNIITKVPKLNRSSSYDIGTPLGTAGIRGTVVNVAVTEQASTFVVAEGMIQVTKGAQSFFIGDGSDNGASGNTRTGKEGNPQEQAVIISTDENYTPPPNQVSGMQQQAQQFSQTASQNISRNAMSGAPAQESPATGTDGGTDGSGSGGDGGGGSGPPAPAPFSGGGGGSSGGGPIYSN